MQKIIEFADKVALNENADIPEINKVTDDNINEIKSVVNGSLQGTNAMGSIVVDDVNCKNLFAGSMYNGIINQSGTYITNNARITNTTSNGFYLPAGTYTLSIANLDACTIVIKNASGTVIQDLADSWKTLPFTFTTTQDGYICFSAKKNNDATLDPNDYAPQLEKGSTATSYIKGKKIIKEQDGYVKESTTFYANDFKCRNMFIPTLTNEGVSIAKNNCNLSLVNDEYTFVATGSDMYFGQVTTQNTAYASNKGTLYDVEGLSSISFTITNPLFTTNFITAYDSSKNSLGYTLFNTNTGTYTIPAGAKYITLRAGKNDAVSGTTYKAKIQLEAGLATPYTPYKNFENEEIYSTNEVKIGTWIDGKDLYRKVFTITSLTSSNTNLVDVSGLSIDFAKISGTIITSTGAKFPMNLYDSASNYSAIFLSDTGYIRGRAVIGSGTLSKCIVILEYTKTTSGTRMLSIESEEENR